MFNNLPKVFCDFNAAGLSGDPDDNCYYGFDEMGLSDFGGPREGLHVFLYDYEDIERTEIVGCEAILEKYQISWLAQPAPDSWLARPIENSWYRGKIPWIEEIEDTP